MTREQARGVEGERREERGERRERGWIREEKEGGRLGGRWARGDGRAFACVDMCWAETWRRGCKFTHHGLPTRYRSVRWMLLLSECKDSSPAFVTKLSVRSSLVKLSHLCRFSIF